MESSNPWKDDPVFSSDQEAKQYWENMENGSEPGILVHIFCKSLDLVDTVSYNHPKATGVEF